MPKFIMKIGGALALGLALLSLVWWPVTHSTMEMAAYDVKGCRGLMASHSSSLRASSAAIQHTAF